MNRHSELEIKFRAEGIDPLSLKRLMADGGALYEAGYRYFKPFFKIEGMDFYYGQGKNALRHRFDGKEGFNTLTVKKRKSKKSLKDRHEVDLKMENGQMSALDIKAFLLLSGWKELFRLRKRYWIAHIQSLKTKAIICLALYDVSSPGKKTRRFLEAEVERDSDVPVPVGKKELKFFEEFLRKHYGLDSPVNKSLYEYYK